LQEVPHLREKTARIGLIARSLAIFRVDEVIIYEDKPTDQARSEGQLLEKILVYQNTPQYLRKILFERSAELEYAGTLPPLRTPNHPDKANPSMGQVRDAVVTSAGEYSEVDAGFPVPVHIHARPRKLEKVTVRITRLTPRIEGELVKPSELAIYWGFRVTRSNFTLGQLVRGRKENLTISTSRKGADIREVMDKLRDAWKAPHEGVLILFGSPREGVLEILAREQADVNKLVDFNINTLPSQGVETVRSEEALLASLSVFNLLEEA
jgi:predicted SPOUT superfamily RNA methylase MTH1